MTSKRATSDEAVYEFRDSSRRSTERCAESLRYERSIDVEKDAVLPNG